VLAHRGRTVRPAAFAVAIACVYMGAMVLSARSARAYVRDIWTQANGRPPAALMVGPVPINPLRKTVIVDAGGYYERGTFTWVPRTVRFEPSPVPKRDNDPAALQARTDAEFQAVLVWARFPYYETTRTEGGTRVTLADMRFGPRLFRATAVVPDN
jgi:hypothetical protein